MLRISGRPPKVGVHMLSLAEACQEDEYPEVCDIEEADSDLNGGWDVDLFLEEDLRPEARFFAGTRPNVKLLCRGGRTIAAHREILAEREYFDALLDFEDRAADSVSVDEDVEVLLELVRWIYCRDASVDKDLAAHVLRLAGACGGLEDLEDHCGRALAAPSLRPKGAVAKDADSLGGGVADVAAAEAERRCGDEVPAGRGAAGDLGEVDAADSAQVDKAIAEPVADCGPLAEAAAPSSGLAADSLAVVAAVSEESNRKKKD